MAKPVTASRCDAEDLRSRTVVRHRFLLDRVGIARDPALVHVQPKLALVNPADATQANLVLADLAVAGTRCAHDLVRALDRPPELGDLPRRLARRLPDIEDFRFRDHLYRYTGPMGIKHFLGQNRRMLPSTFAPPTDCPLFLVTQGTVNSVPLEARLGDTMDGSQTQWYCQ